MDCLITVLKSIGMFLVGLIVVGAAVTALMVAGFGTAKFFGLPEWACAACFMLYFVVTIGTLTGVMECLRTREIRRIMTAR